MFYIIFISKIFLFYFPPIFSLFLKSSKSILNISSLIQVLWIIYAGFLSYIPFYYYYNQNEVNIQHLIPPYFLIIILFLFLILPFIYFILMKFIFNKARIYLKVIGVIFLIISSSFIFGIEIYNHSKRVVLENICYANHNSSVEQLECCLKAEYIWNEGFSFLNETPSNCYKFMNWND